MTTPTDWNRRYREYTEKIKTGSVLEIAEVLRDLCVLKRKKKVRVWANVTFGKGAQKVISTQKTKIKR